MGKKWHLSCSQSATVAAASRSVAKPARRATGALAGRPVGRLVHRNAAWPQPVAAPASSTTASTEAGPGWPGQAKLGHGIELLLVAEGTRSTMPSSCRLHLTWHPRRDLQQRRPQRQGRGSHLASRGVQERLLLLWYACEERARVCSRRGDGRSGGAGTLGDGVRGRMDEEVH